MDEYGITVKLFFYKKIYSWEDLKYKSIVVYTGNNTSEINEKWGCFATRSLYGKTIFTKSNPLRYSTLFRPISFIYIFFIPEEVNPRILNKQVLYFPMNENKFMSKMKEWGVFLDQTIITN